MHRPVRARRRRLVNDEIERGVKLRGGGKKYFIVCKNVYPKNSYHVTGRYDLKGSTVGRLAAPNSSVKKDLDLMAMEAKLALGPARAVAAAGAQPR
jgi:hypothetical protein